MTAGGRKAAFGSAASCLFGFLIVIGAMGHASSADGAAGIGVYFDPDARMDRWVCDDCANTFFTVYVIATGAEQWIGGAAYSLMMDPRLCLTSVTYPPGSQSGDWWSGVEVTLADCRACAGAGVLLSTLTFTTYSPFFQSVICVGPPSSLSDPQLFDCGGLARAAEGLCAFITTPGPIALESESWGAVKALYDR